MTHEYMKEIITGKHSLLGAYIKDELHSIHGRKTTTEAEEQEYNQLISVLEMLLQRCEFVRYQKINRLTATIGTTAYCTECKKYHTTMIGDIRIGEAVICPPCEEKIMESLKNGDYSVLKG